jgi:hypothetical protein
MPNAASSLRTCQRGHMFSSICKKAANRPTDSPSLPQQYTSASERVADADKVAAAFLRLPMLHITQTAELFSRRSKKNCIGAVVISSSHTMAKFPIGAGCKFACQSSFMICYVCWSCFCSCCLCLVWTFCNKLRCSKYMSCSDQYTANASID